jgi:hypothetical protein
MLGPLMRYAGVSVGTAGLALAVLLLLTWWASGSAAAAAQQPVLLTTLPHSLPRAGTWTWLLERRDVLSEPGLIAAVGSGLIAVAALVRRTTS